MNDSITYIRHFKHTNARIICCYVFYWMTIIQYQSMNDNKCIIWIKKFEYLCEVSLKQNLDLHESFEWIRLFWWEGFQIFHYWSSCVGNHFFVVLFCIKNVRKYHLHKVNEDFSDIFWLIQKNQQKSDSIQNMPANEYFMQNHTFLMYWERKGPKTWLKNLKTKGTPFWFLLFLLVFRVCL